MSIHSQTACQQCTSLIYMESQSPANNFRTKARHATPFRCRISGAGWLAARLPGTTEVSRFVVSSGSLQGPGRSAFMAQIA
jgi:hypothetical protein